MTHTAENRYARDARDYARDPPAADPESRNASVRYEPPEANESAELVAAPRDLSAAARDRDPTRHALPESRRPDAA